jgi:hypothetical protein
VLWHTIAGIRVSARLVFFVPNEFIEVFALQGVGLEGEV